MYSSMHSPIQQRLQTADGISLAVSDWQLPAKSGVEVKAPILIMHGLGEHHGRYRHVAAFFNACGRSVRAYDLRGHGNSSGTRGDVGNDHSMLDDARLIVEDLTRLNGMAPILCGHSMGGLFAAALAVAGAVPLTGLILSSPALAVPLNPIEKILLKVLSVVAPGFGMPNGVKSAFLSHDAAVVHAYDHDPLVHNKITARLLHSMLAAIASAHEQAPHQTVPTLLVVAGADRLVDARGSQAFYDQLPPELARLKCYPALYHEILNEIGSQQVFDDIRNWLAVQN